jgi:hypothetical protein
MTAAAYGSRLKAGTTGGFKFQTADMRPQLRERTLIRLPSPRAAVGRGRGWGVARHTPKQRFLPRHPPPPTPPRHAQERVEGGENNRARLRDLAAQCARGLLKIPALLIRGRRECRAPDAPDSRVCEGRKQKAHALVRSHRNHPAFPTQWFYGLCRTLPGDRAFLSPSPLRSLLPRNLTPASRHQDHTILPSARRRSRLQHRLRPPHPAPRP